MGSDVVWGGQIGLRGGPMLSDICTPLRSDVVRCGPMYSDAVINHTRIYRILSFTQFWHKNNIFRTKFRSALYPK
jgi:hypothetical protein